MLEHNKQEYNLENNITENQQEINNYKKRIKRNTIAANVFGLATLAGFLVGAYAGLFIKGNDNYNLKISLLFPALIEATITAEMHSLSLKRREYYMNRLSELERI
jgi:hypothetical protein